MRLDQWLWAVRIYKTRTSAADAIKGGLVKVGDEPVKPAREVKPGDLVTARVNQMTRTVVVVDSPKSRVGAKLVAQFMEDRTPPEEYQRRREVNFLPPGFRPQGSGRPTKKERREIDSFDL
jgi:ribosome-associated heat shock protein Hsp15